MIGSSWWYPCQTIRVSPKFLFKLPWASQWWVTCRMVPKGNSDALQETLHTCNTQHLLGRAGILGSGEPQGYYSKCSLTRFHRPLSAYDAVTTAIKSKFRMSREDNFGQISGSREIKSVTVFCHCSIESPISSHRRKQRVKKIKEQTFRRTHSLSFVELSP